MKSFLNKLTLLICICFLFACNNNENPNFKEVLKSKEGHLRGVKIGHSIKETKEIESQEFLVDEMVNYLHYEYEISMGNSYTVSYDFSEDDKLYEIEVAIFLDVIKDADMLFNNYTDHFNRKYGIGKKEADGFLTWNSTSNITKTPISFSMINDSDSYGFITIFVRDLSY